MKKRFIIVIVFILLAAFTFSFTACDKKSQDEESAPLTSEELWTKISTGDGEWWNDEFEQADYAKDFNTMVGGFIKGVCHPTEQYEQTAAANIEWVRFDIDDLPFDKDGNLTSGYLEFKERAKGYADNGFKVFAVTPYPREYIDFGLDPRDESSRAEIMQIARFYIEDLQGIVAAIQVTNEMGIDHFTLPLTVKEASEFIGIQMQAMYRYRGNVAVGFNLGGINGFVTVPRYINEMDYMKYADYVGADIYLGCFEDIMTSLASGKSLLSVAYKATYKPIVLTEFGYMGAGFYKTDAEKLAILQSYGAVGDTLADAQAYTETHMRDIIFNENFPAKFREHLLEVGFIDEETMTAEELTAAYNRLGTTVFGNELKNHIYKEIDSQYQVDGYPHTEEGQGKYLTDFLAMARKVDYVYGAIVYCYSDSDSCYICGQTDCPVETGWGLVDGDGNPKDSYYAIQEAFRD